MTRWPHSPSHTVDHPGSYILTAGTYQRIPNFLGHEKLELLHDVLMEELDRAGWQLQAWAIFPNHYHFVGLSPEAGIGLTELTRRVHGRTSIHVNQMDLTPRRRVWYRCWETRITYERSYLARLAYLHNNPIKHGLVQDARQYRWCSARWFEDRASRPFFESVMSAPTDRVNVIDDF
jgi:putative transposase